MFRFIRLIFCVLFLLPSAAHAQERNETYALILSYQEFKTEEDRKILKDHLDFLRSEKIRIVSLSEIRNFLTTDEGQVIALTFDKATPETVSLLAPIMINLQIPFTLLVSFNDWKTSKDLSYLQQLAAYDFVDIELHIMNDNFDKNVKNFQHEINRARGLYREIFNYSPISFSFIEGLYTKEMRDVVSKYDFDSLLGRHTGALTIQNIDGIWPRFTVSPYRNFTVQGLDMILQTRPLYVRDVLPQETLVRTATPSVGFTIHSDADISSLKCFIHGKGQSADQVILKNRVELRPKLEQGERNEFHCLLRDGEDEEGKALWRRHGFLLKYDDE